MDRKHVVVPLRVVRAITGVTEADAPDVDDRGWVMGTRPGTWGETELRGPMVGLMVGGGPVRLRVVREDLDDTAKLFIKSTKPDLVAVTEPTNGGPLPADGVFKIKGVKDVANQGVAVQIRLGSADGPVLGEIEPHIFNPLRIPIRPHFVRIDAGTVTGDVPDQPIQRIVDRMKAIWKPCGVELTWDGTTVTDTIRLAVANQVKLDGPDPFGEPKLVLGLQRKRLNLPASQRDRQINWYIIGSFSTATTVGLGIHRALADQLSTDPGIFTTADGVDNDAEFERVARTVAHEIGHFFTLAHVQNRNADNAVQDTYGMRQLMFPLSFFDAVTGVGSLTKVPRRQEVGYGDLVRGCLITLKNHSGHATDGECATARKAISENRWF